MKKLCFLLLLLEASIVFAQEKVSFYIEIPSIENVFPVTHDPQGNRLNSLRTRNYKLNRLVNSYEIYSIKKIFTKSKRAALSNIYLIECNDRQLMEDLFEKFKSIYPRVERADYELLYTPNDYGTSGGYTVEDQNELDLIRAPEAWDITKGSEDIIIGIADPQRFSLIHEDTANKIDVVVNPQNNTPGNSSHHGTHVSSVAAADTNNGVGMSAIGYDSFIYAGVGYSAVMDQLSLFAGVKVLNASWGGSSPNPPTTPNITSDLYDEIVEDREVVVVASAGNGQESGSGNPTHYYTPASYKNVISVSSIGHTDEVITGNDEVEFFKNSHNFLFNDVVRSHQHNDSVDIVAPGYRILTAYPWFGATNGYVKTRGTSYSAPMVAGTIALMFDVNYCLKPKEVETILKLTAVKIDNLPENIQYYGKLGAGKLDAYEAIKMAKDMAAPLGTVEVKDRILYRPWFYKLETAPYEIKMTNNDVSGGSKLKFKARNNIEILSGVYSPGVGGYIDLSIDEGLALDCPPPPIGGSLPIGIGFGTENSNTLIEIYPTVVRRDIELVNKTNEMDHMSTIKVFDLFGMEVFKADKINSKNISLNLERLNIGLYIIKVIDRNGQVTHTQKIIKN